jgi:hypothetical protein
MRWGKKPASQTMKAKASRTEVNFVNGLQGCGVNRKLRATV